MDITVEKVIAAINEMNSRKAQNSVIKLADTPIGADSLAFFLGVKQEQLHDILDEMERFGIIEYTSRKVHHNGGHQYHRKFKLKD
jgi:hypothetical protein